MRNLRNFYTFSGSDAMTKGTTLKWKYAEVPGVEHNGHKMYSTPAAGGSIPIAERLLFETPYHTVPKLTPLASFSFSYLSDSTVQFYNNSTAAGTFLWNFGDSTTSTEKSPKHIYHQTDTFTVTLTATNSNGYSNKNVKKNYVVIKGFN